MTFADIHSLYSEPREFERFFFDLLWKDGFVCSKFRHTRYTTVIRKNGLPQNCLSVLPLWSSGIRYSQNSSARHQDSSVFMDPRNVWCHRQDRNFCQIHQWCDRGELPHHKAHVPEDQADSETGKWHSCSYRLRCNRAGMYFPMAEKSTENTDGEQKAKSM